MLLTMKALAPRLSTVWITFSSVETEGRRPSRRMLLADAAQAGQPVGARMRRSSSTMSGICAATSGQHLRARVAFPTTSKSGASSRARFTPSTMRRWSSAMRTRTGKS